LKIFSRNFLGEQVVEGIQFEADSGTNEWSPGGPNPYSDHYKNILSETHPTWSYLESDTAGKHETFNEAEAVMSHGELVGYQLDIFVELDAAGSENMHLEGGSSFVVTSTSWQHHGEIREVTTLPTQQGFERD
jgi:hypothetical protein